MKWNYVVRAAVLVGCAALVAAYAENEPQKKATAPLKTWSCTTECGFTITGRNEAELVELIEQHQRKVHDQYLTDDDTRAQLKLVSPEAK